LVSHHVPAFRSQRAQARRHMRRHRVMKDHHCGAFEVGRTNERILGRSLAVDERERSLRAWREGDQPARGRGACKHEIAITAQTGSSRSAARRNPSVHVVLRIGLSYTSGQRLLDRRVEHRACIPGRCTVHRGSTKHDRFGRERFRLPHRKREACGLSRPRPRRR
jgi:hypothetical protein